LRLMTSTTLKWKDRPGPGVTVLGIWSLLGFKDGAKSCRSDHVTTRPFAQRSKQGKRPGGRLHVGNQEMSVWGAPGLTGLVARRCGAPRPRYLLNSTKSGTAFPRSWSESLTEQIAARQPGDDPCGELHHPFTDSMQSQRSWLWTNKGRGNWVLHPLFKVRVPGPELRLASQALFRFAWRTNAATRRLPAVNAILGSSVMIW